MRSHPTSSHPDLGHTVCDLLVYRDLYLAVAKDAAYFLLYQALRLSGNQLFLPWPPHTCPT